MCKSKCELLKKGSSPLNKTLVLRKPNSVPHPTTNFILGYGSLINADSKEVTHPGLGPSFPVRVHGYKRIFNCFGNLMGKSTTFLGLEESLDSSFTGVTFAVKSRTTLLEFDEREKYYKRVAVKPENVEFLDDDLLKKEGREYKFWIYVPKPQHIVKPGKSHPIHQSYFDIFVDGCLKIGKQFDFRNYAQECLQSTEGWLQPFLGDDTSSWDFDREDGIKKLKIVHDVKEIDKEIMFYVETYLLFIGGRKENDIEYFLEK